MKVGQTIKQEPIDITELSGEELNITEFGYSFEKFKNRRALHHSEDSIQGKFIAYFDIMAWSAFIEFANKAYTNKRHEACGLIMGKYFRDQYGEFIVGTQFEPGTGSSTSAVLCEISYEDNARISLKHESSGLLQVIWIHSHPGYGVFYSAQDYETIREKYYQRFHVGIVVDNLQNKYEAYKVSENGKVDKFRDTYLVNLEKKDFRAFPPCSPGAGQLEGAPLFKRKKEEFEDYLPEPPSGVIAEFTEPPAPRSTKTGIDMDQFVPNPSDPKSIQKKRWGNISDLLPYLVVFLQLVTICLMIYLIEMVSNYYAE